MLSVMAEPVDPDPREKKAASEPPRVEANEPSDAPTSPVAVTEARASQPKMPSAPPAAEAKAPSTPSEAKAPSVPPVAEAKAPSVPPVAEAKAPSVPPADRMSTREPVAPVAVSRSVPPSFAPPKRPSERPSFRAPSGGGPLEAYEALAKSARLADLVTVAQKVLAEAAMLRPTGWSFAGKASAAADEAKLARDDAETPYGNVLKILEAGPEGDAERALASAIHAHAIAEGPRKDEDRIAGDVLWLAAHTAFDATSLLDRALGEEADDLWVAISDRVKRASTPRPLAIVGCAALASSTSARAKELTAELAGRVADPVLLRLLGPNTNASREVRLEGELVAPPRSPVVTTILAFTGILFVMHAVGLVARLALAYKRPTEVVLSGDGVRMKTRMEMLGKTLKEREHVIVRAGLVRVVREVRYPRIAFYAGLFALALGSYVGVRAFADGVRAASPSLLGVGLLIVVFGIAADFALGTLIPGTRGRCRIAFVPRSGATLAVGDVDAKRADDALQTALK